MRERKSHICSPASAGRLLPDPSALCKEERKEACIIIGEEGKAFSMVWSHIVGMGLEIGSLEYLLRLSINQ